MTSFLAHAHVPAIIRNMSEAECQAIGQLSKVNYMQVPDAEPITDIMQDMTMPPRSHPRRSNLEEAVPNFTTTTPPEC